jgi:hypothetical protein
MKIEDGVAPGLVTASGSSGRSAQETSLDALAWWFNGYCFDGTSSCFNPFPVLQALKQGTLKGSELEGSSGTNWLGLHPGHIVDGQQAAERPIVSVDAVNRLDIADIEGQSVDVQAMLLQLGLLTLYPQLPLPVMASSAVHTSRADGAESVSAALPRALIQGKVLCQVPNEYARRSMQNMASKALAGMKLGSYVPALLKAMSGYHACEFESVIKAVLQELPYSLLKAKEGPDREAPFHAALWAFLRCCVPVQVASTAAEVAVQGGRADMVLRFTSKPVVWVLELGVSSAEIEVVQREGEKKLAQARRYAAAYDIEGAEVVCCSIIVSKVQAASVATGAPEYATKFLWRRVQPGNGDPRTILPSS